MRTRFGPILKITVRELIIDGERRGFLFIPSCHHNFASAWNTPSGLRPLALATSTTNYILYIFVYEEARGGDVEFDVHEI